MNINSFDINTVNGLAAARVVDDLKNIAEFTEAMESITFQQYVTKNVPASIGKFGEAKTKQAMITTAKLFKIMGPLALQ